jgi:hypothetical protein
VEPLPLEFPAGDDVPPPDEPDDEPEDDEPEDDEPEDELEDVSRGAAEAPDDRDAALSGGSELDPASGRVVTRVYPMPFTTRPVPVADPPGLPLPSTPSTTNVGPYPKTE